MPTTRRRPRRLRPVQRARLDEVMERLSAAYPEAQCALDHASPYELLIATILSAQCTDERVNMVTPALFAAYPTPAALADAPIHALEEMIHSTGFFRNKARNIKGATQRIVEAYGGRVPDTMEDLLTLPGVARKTANVVLGSGYGKAEGVVVDTHVQRLSNRLGFTKQADPVKIEADLVEIVPREKWIAFSHTLILHGRQVCDARSPRCDECIVRDLCPSAQPRAATRAARSPAQKSRGGRSMPATRRRAPRG